MLSAVPKDNHQMSYANLIRELQPDYDPAAIEAWMRVELPTLDGISREAFAREAAEAARAIDGSTPEMTLMLRQSYGL